MLTKLHRLSGRRRSVPEQILIVASALVAATGLRFLVDPLLTDGYPFITFFPVIVLTAFVVGLPAAIALSVVSGFAAWYLFIPPYGTFELSRLALTAVFFYALIVGTDLAVIRILRMALERLAAEKRRSERLAQSRTLMFHELQHRVSNNLQVISSLLKLQQRAVADPAAQSALELASARVSSVARIQRALHDPARQEIDFKVLLQEITTEILATSGAEDTVSYQISCDPVPIGPDMSVPLALIVTEYIWNAIEHGLRPGGRLTLNVSLKDIGDGTARLEVSDDGAGLPTDYDPDQMHSLGLQIAHQFARQLGGKITVGAGGPGQGRTVARLDFPLRRETRADEGDEPATELPQTA